MFRRSVFLKQKIQSFQKISIKKHNWNYSLPFSFSKNNLSSNNNNNNNNNVSLSLYDKILKRYGAEATAPENYNRWKVVPVAVCTHLCLGGVYSWSLFNGPLSRELGVVTSISNDWSLSNIVPIFSTIILMNGISGFIFGKWTDKVGPRIALTIGGTLYGGGLILGSIGIALHSLPLVYIGYGVIGGLGHGICYLPPIATVIKWFPDSPGRATGMAGMGTGGGAIIATPFVDRWLTKNFVAPTKVDESILATQSIITNDKGEHFITLPNSNSPTQIVQVNSHELASSGFTQQVIQSLEDGAWYIVNTGNTGASTTMLSLGLIYLTVIGTCSTFARLPHPSWKPPSSSSKSTTTTTTTTTTTQNNNNNNFDIIKPLSSMTAEEAIKTPQFWLMWTAFLCLSTSGMGVISTAKTIMSEVFSSSLPLIVTASFSSTYVMAISAANLGGRFGWASISDKIGRFNTFNIFSIGGCILYFSIPYYVSQVVETHSLAPLALFYGSTLLLISFFGGNFGAMPAYEADIFGAKNVGAIHGRMMTACGLSGVLGPMLLTKIRRNKEISSIYDLTKHIDPIKFQEQFGVPINEIDKLIENKSVTIPRLMNLIPENANIIDPTPFLYDNTMYTMSAIMAGCALANILARRCGNPRIHNIQHTTHSNKKN